MYCPPVYGMDNDTLYVIYTASVENPKRGAMVSIIPL